MLRRAEKQRGGKEQHSIRLSSTAKEDGWIWQVLNRLDSELLMGDSNEEAASKQEVAEKRRLVDCAVKVFGTDVDDVA